MSKGIVVLSGGMDSTVLTYSLFNDYAVDQIDLVSFNYGQRHAKELLHARITAKNLGLKIDIIDMRSWGLAIATPQGSLVGGSEVPEGHYAEDNMRQTVVPNRNMTMLSMAAGIAVSRNFDFVATGVHAGDHFQYPDCRPEFIRQVEATILTANKGFISDGFAIYTPYVNKTKAQIATIGENLDVPWRNTWSCYKGGETHCGRCGTCVERAEAFYLAEVSDPTDYEDPDFWKTVTKENK